MKSGESRSLKEKLMKLEQKIMEYPGLQDFTGGVCQESILMAQKALEVAFPISYRWFLMTFGMGSFGDLEIFGLVEAEKGLQKYLDDDSELAAICHDIALTTKLSPDSHGLNPVSFAWGTMEFYGVVSSLSISYQMFNRNGQPVRVKMDMSLLGEEKGLLNEIRANPKQSPDRTKFRRLNPREELWMLADAEYNDVSCWKEIARENGILNPRKVDYTRRLKIPAL